ncbi:MAG: arylsulfatase [Acidobacteriota bacterium]
MPRLAASVFQATVFQATVFRLTVLALGAIVSACQPAVGPPASRPNVLLILADDLGFSDLGVLGSEIRTPHLDALAGRGLVLHNFHVSPSCSPTRAMLLTGADPHVAGLGTMAGDADGPQVGRPEYLGYMGDRVVTIAARLRDAGYLTAMAGKWHLGSTPETGPKARGFLRSFGPLVGGASHFADRAALLGGGTTPYVEDGVEVELRSDFFSSEDYTDRLLEYVAPAVERGQPFFAYAAYTAPHWPLQVPDEDLDLYAGDYDEGYEVLARRRQKALVERGIVPGTELPGLPSWVPAWAELSKDERAVEARRMELFAAMVENLDRHIGRLLQGLEELGVLEDTLIVFLSDNGAEGNLIGTMYDNEEILPVEFDTSFTNMGRPRSYVWTGPGWALAQSAPFRLFKAIPYEGGVRTPALFVHPQLVQRRGLDATFASALDFVPTVLQVAGVEHDVSLEGRSLLPYLAGDTETVHGAEPLFAWELFGRRAVTKGRWKLTWAWQPYGTEQWQLFDLESDPSESVDLAARQPEKYAEMLAAWESYVARHHVLLPRRDMGYGLVDGDR